MLSGETNTISFVKSGVGLGGASIADVSLLARLRSPLHHVNVITGYVSAEMAEQLDGFGIPYTIDRVLDRESAASPDVIRNRLIGHLATENSSILFSQALCAAEVSIGKAALEISESRPAVFRQHNHMSEELYARFGELTSGDVFSVTDSMSQRIGALNPRVAVHTLPPLVDRRRFDMSELQAEQIRQQVRERLDVSADSVMLFQPTRVDRKKGGDYAIRLAEKLASRIGHPTTLVIAGGRENAAATRYKNKLVEIAGRHALCDVQFLDGSHTHHGTDRIADVMHASDAVVFPSYQESFGLAVTEASLCKKPVLARNYVGAYGEPIFEEVYGHFDVITENTGSAEPSQIAVNGLIEVLENVSRRNEMIDSNYQHALAYTFDSPAYAEQIDTLERLLTSA